ncbi:NUDIX domain-containing protein [Stackebrandtia nassauensis]|uniref:NUDIX hydrolase n=1 Tax=Stackebrandtia nassauensis (strain DSM 44728 / CIP 108903 / NRRL B-16338 / NBRC 102104 / LLR-40K-21) TaxID=446470 RepID=D3QAN7_STANL|nr:NUDIX domain-containing protein [Stackebrandtia nassauensis]ADD44683.1 NUDIX hydrolase [Stackebrandtia nassauensis DSM 44728]
METPQFFGVNVEIALRRGERWLLIERGRRLRNAPGMLAFPGGRVEAEANCGFILEDTARREAAEEVGLDLSDVSLRYVRSEFFVGDDGNRYIGATFTAELPRGREPRVAAPEEVEAVHWLTADEVKNHPKCPEWTLLSLSYAASVR